MELPRWHNDNASACQCRSRKRLGLGSLDEEESLEKEMMTHSSILDWEIPWTEEPGGLQSTGVTKSWTQLSN